MQYILGEVEFYGLQIKVNPSVLIPRQETEIVVEAVLEYCRNKPPQKILDIGTGSGNISISLAKHLPETMITAIDVSLEALETAKCNSIDNGVGDRISCRLINIITDGDQLPQDFDLIVSNPPYIGREEFDKLPAELRVYEPAGALTDNLDGLSFYRKIISDAPKWLKKGGALFFEAGEGQSGLIKLEMEQNSFHNIMIFKDYLNIDRVVSGELF